MPIKGFKKSRRLTIDQCINDVLAVFLNKVIDVAEDTTVIIQVSLPSIRNFKGFFINAKPMIELSCIPHSELFDDGRVLMLQKDQL